MPHTLFWWRDTGPNEVEYAIVNELTLNSFFLHAIENDLWRLPLIPTEAERYGGDVFPYMGTITQVYKWTEDNPSDCTSP